MDWNVLEAARRLFGELEGGPRFWWGKNDRSLIVDSNNNYLVWNRMGWVLDGDRRLEVSLPPVKGWEPAHDRIDYWIAEGLTGETIGYFCLGHFRDSRLGDCWAMPVRDGQGKTLQIKYRIQDWPEGEPLKYRILPPVPTVEPFWALQENVSPGRGHLPNTDLLFAGGEKKAMRLWQEGFNAMSSTAGILALPDAWLDIINRFGKVYIVFDPSEQWAAALHARRIGPKAWVVWLPGGLDAFWANGGTAEQLQNELRQARPLGALL